MLAIQPKYGEKGIPEGKIRIIGKRLEEKNGLHFISEEDSEAEGGYGRTEYEELYEKMYPGWQERYAYYFRYVPTSPTPAKEDP